MTEIMPFPENNYETVLLDRPFRVSFLFGMENGLEPTSMQLSGGQLLAASSMAATP